MEVKQEGDFKMKSKPKTPRKLNKPNEVTEVKISNTAKEAQGTVVPEVTEVVIKKEDTNAIQEQSTESGVLRTEQPEVELQEVGQRNEVAAENDVEEQIQVIQEVTNEEIKSTAQELQNAIEENKYTGKPLPENIEKLVSFMEETGGTLEDYVRLNSDYSSVSEEALLREYYKRTKPHLDAEDLSLIHI